MQVLYARIGDQAHAYIAAIAAHSGLSMATVTNLIIEEARARGWQITTNGARITDTSRSPAAAPLATTPRDQDPPRGTPPQPGAGPTHPAAR